MPEVDARLTHAETLKLFVTSNADRCVTTPPTAASSCRADPVLPATNEYGPETVPGLLLPELSGVTPPVTESICHRPASVAPVVTGFTVTLTIAEVVAIPFVPIAFADRE